MNKNSFNPSNNGDNLHVSDKHDNTTTIELRKKLIEQLVCTYDDEDVENIRKTMRQAKGLYSMNENDSAEEAFKDFKNNYLAEANEMQAIIKSYDKPEENTQKSKDRSFGLVSRMAFSALLIYAFFAFTTTSLAQFKIMDSIVTWTQDLFYKESSTSIDYNNNLKKSDISAEGENYDYESIETKLNISILKPHYIPEGYDLSIIESFNVGNTTTIMARYENELDEIIKFQIYILNGSNGDSQFVIDKTNHDVDIYTFYGIEYYVLKNSNWYVASWSDQNIEYSVSGISSKKDMQNFLKNLEYN